MEELFRYCNTENQKSKMIYDDTISFNFGIIMNLSYKNT